MLETYEWSGAGFEPLVFSENWQAALLNWEPLFDRKNLDEIERHNHTDEVFVFAARGRQYFSRGPRVAPCKRLRWQPAKFTRCRQVSGTTS